jgi:hypothetical protein
VCRNHLECSNGHGSARTNCNVQSLRSGQTSELSTGGESVTFPGRVDRTPRFFLNASDSLT